jgi:DNA-binding LacI/PurR family transcriptional regulator
MGSEKEGMEPMSQSNKKSVTSKDVANLAGVSQATVSRVFSRRDYVRDDTVEKVMAAAKELGYKPVTASKGLGGRETNLIAVVSLNFVNPFYQTLLIRLSEMVSAMGKQLLFVESPYEQDLDDILYRVLQYNVDAVIVLSAALSVRMSDKFSRVKVPLVLFNCQYDSRYFFSVCSDNVDAGSMVADYLVAKGYDSFGFISGKPSRQTSVFRHKGFADTLARHGFHKIAVASGDYSYSSGAKALMQIFRQGKLPRAIFCANDLMAFGAMDVARHKLGLQVPQDIAFVGFDSLEQAQWSSYQLTSVSQPVNEMVEYTQNYLHRKFTGQETSGGYVLLKTKMIERTSA